MKAALLTIVRNEKIFLSVWLKYYMRFFQPKDIFIIDNASTDNSITLAKKQYDFNLINEKEKIADSEYITKVVKKWHYFLFTLYDIILLCSIDEIIAPDPQFFPNLTTYIQFFAVNPRKFCFSSGFNVLHDIKYEKPIIWNQPLLKQRRYWNYSYVYCKPALSKVPLDYDKGLHSIIGIEPHLTGNIADPTLINIHLRRIDWDLNNLRWKKETEGIFMQELPSATQIPERIKTII